MDAKDIIIRTSLTPEELINKLRSITITDFSLLHSSPNAVYYGKITANRFTIKNVHYSPMTPIPDIQGEIRKEENSTLVKVKMDIRSNFVLTKKMYYTTLLPIGLIVMLLSVLVLGGTDYQIQGLIFSSSFIVCAILVVYLTKLSLNRVKNKELRNFSARIEGKIVENQH